MTLTTNCTNMQNIRLNFSAYSKYKCRLFHVMYKIVKLKPESYEK